MHWCLEKHGFEYLEMDLANLQHHLLVSEHLATDVKEDREVYCCHLWKIVKLCCVQSLVIARGPNNEFLNEYVNIMLTLNRLALVPMIKPA